MHQKCASSSSSSFFCRHCLASSLPLVELQVDDFFQAIGVTAGSLKMNLVRNCSHKLNLNPFENLDDGFIDNVEIDADRNYYNINSNIINDYFDSTQIDQILLPNKSKNLKFTDACQCWEFGGKYFKCVS